MMTITTTYSTMSTTAQLGAWGGAHHLKTSTMISMDAMTELKTKMTITTVSWTFKIFATVELVTGHLFHQTTMIPTVVRIQVKTVMMTTTRLVIGKTIVRLAN